MASPDLAPEPHARNHEDDDNLESLVFSLMDCYPALKEEIIRRTVEEPVVSTALHEARDSVKRVIRARKLDVRPEDLARIDGCTNINTLHEWLARVATASSAEEAFALD